MNNEIEKIRKEDLEGLTKEQIIVHFLTVQDLLFQAKDLLDEAGRMLEKLI